MRRLTALTVCLLVVLAGCNAAPGGGEPTATTSLDATETAPDATSTTADSDGDAADRPPGLSAASVTDAAALAAAHEESLAGKSYTYDREVRIVADDGTELGRWSQHAQVGAERLRLNQTQTGEGVSVVGLTVDDTRLYTNGSVTFWNASVYASGYRQAPGRGFAASTFSSERLLADALNTSETSVEPVERGGETWFRVRAANGSETVTAELSNGTATVTATNATATALVAPDGFVRNLTYEYDFERGDVSGHRTMTIGYSAVGETDVEVPAWVAEAKSLTGESPLAPGLNRTRVIDPAELADAHEAVLHNTSYAVETNLTARAPDGTLRARLNSTTKTAHDPVRRVGRSVVDGTTPRAVGLAGFDLRVWATENGTWYAVETSNGTDYRKVADELRPPAAARTDRDVLFVLFSGLETAVAGVEFRDGTPLYRVESTGVENPEAIASQFNVESVENVSLTALVDQRGAVREYRVAYTATLGENTSRVERTTRFTALGETTVERPPWVDEAKATTNATAG
jgi:hypothetical protein